MLVGGRFINFWLTEAGVQVKAAYDAERAFVEVLRMIAAMQSKP